METEVTEQAAWNDIPIACTLSAAEQLARGAWIGDEALANCREVRELPRGAALRFDDQEGKVEQLAQLIGMERHCCPFFRFTLVFEPDLGPIWLQIEGPEGSEGIIASMVATVRMEGSHLPDAVGLPGC